MEIRKGGGKRWRDKRGRLGEMLTARPGAEKCWVVREKSGRLKDRWIKQWVGVNKGKRGGH